MTSNKEELLFSKDFEDDDEENLLPFSAPLAKNPNPPKSKPLFEEDDSEFVFATTTTTTTSTTTSTNTATNHNNIIEQDHSELFGSAMTSYQTESLLFGNDTHAINKSELFGSTATSEANDNSLLFGTRVQKPSVLQEEEEEEVVVQKEAAVIIPLQNNVEKSDDDQTTCKKLFDDDDDDDDFVFSNMSKLKINDSNTKDFLFGNGSNVTSKSTEKDELFGTSTSSDLFGTAIVGQSPSMLEQSGLIQKDSSSAGGGLFAAVDKEVEERERRRQQEAERIRQIEEEERLHQLKLQQLQREADEAKKQKELLEQQYLLEQQKQQTQPPITAPPPPPPDASFYRDHSSTIMLDSDPLNNPQQNSIYGTASPMGGHAPTPKASSPYHPTVVSSPPPPLPTQPPPKTPQPSLLAGHHNNTPTTTPRKTSSTQHKFIVPTLQHEPFTPKFHRITVSDPQLSAHQYTLLSRPPYWTYCITSSFYDQGREVTFIVRRRYSHFVALEERIKQPGIILPPRPEKHVMRSLEEGLQPQSLQFALTRATELQCYLVQLAQHPLLGASEVLYTFLTLYDDIGAAWPEVSTSVLTKLTATAQKLGNNTNSSILLAKEAGEDNADILALCTSEGHRIQYVHQAMPKVGGALVLIKEYADASNSLGLELQGLVHTLSNIDYSTSLQYMDKLSNGLLRSGRRMNRLSTELYAAIDPFVYEFRQTHNETIAFHDRRTALIKRSTTRSNANAMAMKYSSIHSQQPHPHPSNHLYQRQQSPYAAATTTTTTQSNQYFQQLDQLGMSAALTTEKASEAEKEADRVATILLMEVNRTTKQRRKEWSDSVKVICSSMKESFAENVAIWESCLKEVDLLLKKDGF